MKTASTFTIIVKNDNLANESPKRIDLGRLVLWKPLDTLIFFVYHIIYIFSSQIGLNGVITFDRGVGGYIPEPFPLDFPLISLFWTDINTASFGRAYYRLMERDNKTIEYFEKIDDLVYQARLANSFVAENVLVLTWERAAYYGSTSRSQIVIEN